jgi:serine/threonine-protein kinase
MRQFAPSCQREVGRNYLASRLNHREETEFLLHLDSCTRCRVWLEDDAGDADSWSDARELFHRSGDETITLPVASDRTVREQNPAYAQILGPTDDPEMLGRIGNYEVMGVVGEGGMGIVFKALDRALNRVVAIKVIDPLLAKVGAARQRFGREARAMAAVSHEHVVPIYSVSEHQGLPYFVMEYVPGRSLDRRITEQGPLEVVEIVRIGLQTASALAAAHRHGLIHRDIKPGNLLLQHGVERVLVTDFGLARVVDEASSTQSGMLAGTPQYMAPEHVRCEVIDPRADLFSLGCVMYAMCTGHSPFRADTVYGIIQRIVHDTPRPIREQNAAVPEWLASLIRRLLEKNPAHRLASADELAEILTQELAHLESPAVAPRPLRDWLPQSQPNRLRPRHWGLIAGLIAASVTLMAVLIAGLTEKRGAETVSHQVRQEGEDLSIRNTKTNQHDAGSANRSEVQSSDVPRNAAHAWFDSSEIEIVRQSAQQIENKWQAAETSGALDPWPSMMLKAKNLLSRAAATE